MKLIVTGASGFVAQEIIRQSLSIPQITSVIALARRPIAPPPKLGTEADASKLKVVVIEDYGTYPDDVKTQLAYSDACIWTVAITPSKSRGVDFDEVRRVCQDYPLAGLKAILSTRGDETSDNSSPLRFIYMSGTAAERDQTKSPRLIAQYCLMRGEAENQILAYAADHKNAMEACAAKPGIITAPGQIFKTISTTFLKYTIGLPSIEVGEVSAALLHQAVHGFEKEPLEHDDLLRIGRQALNQRK